MTGPSAETERTPQSSLLPAIGRSVLLNVALALAVLILPIFGIRRSADLSALPLYEVVVYIIYLLAAVSAGLATSQRRAAHKTSPVPLSAPSRFQLIRSMVRYFTERSTGIAALTIVLLYVSCAALLKRLGFGSITRLSDLAAWLGVLLIASGAIVQTVCLFEERQKQSAGNGKKTYVMARFGGIKQPLYMAWLLALLGIPLVYGNLIPYAAIPGIVVLINWRLRRLKAAQEEQVADMS